MHLLPFGPGCCGRTCRQSGSSGWLSLWGIWRQRSVNLSRPRGTLMRSRRGFVAHLGSTARRGLSHGSGGSSVGGTSVTMHSRPGNHLVTPVTFGIVRITRKSARCLGSVTVGLGQHVCFPWSQRRMTIFRGSLLLTSSSFTPTISLSRNWRFPMTKNL
jgi:hypothetical protein